MAGKGIIDLDALEKLSQKIVDRYATKEEVSSKLSSVYTPGGSIDSPKSELLIKDNVGKVYNLTQEFQTTGDYFVEGNEKSYPAGTNIVVIEESSESYKFDVLAGFVDLTGYAKTENIQSMIDSTLEDNLATSEEVESMLNEVFKE